jgi:two-component system, OmpR family, sensor kinase
MSLRRKLLTTFGALALLALLIAGMTVWATFQWQRTDRQLQDHYTRSLLLQGVRATVFRAFKEVPDAVLTGDVDARQEFEAFIPIIEEDFAEWAALADTEEERQQVEQVRGAYEALVRDARQVFDLVDAGQNDAAFQLMEGQLEDEEFQGFQELTEAAVESDQRNREIIRAQTQNTRRTAQIILAIGAFGTLSLGLLLAAYLASDLFRPLRDLERALQNVAHGNFDRRLPEERADEFGMVHRAYNEMAAAMAQRARLSGATIETDGSGDGRESWEVKPSRATLHALVAQLRASVTQLTDGATPDGASEQQQGELLRQIDQLSVAVARVTDFGFPLDLNLARTDIRALLYEVLLRFHDQLVERGVSLELDIAPDVGIAVVDRLKLREALGELVRNALKALPEEGGKLGLRARLDDHHRLLLEVADDGRGADEPLIDQALAETESGPPRRVGLKLTRGVVEQHGGRLTIDSRPGEGTYVQIALPLHED